MTTLRTRELFRDSRLTVVAIEAIEILAERGRIGCHCTVNIRPIAVIITGQGAPCALDMEARSIDIALLRKQLNEQDAADIFRHE